MGVESLRAGATLFDSETFTQTRESDYDPTLTDELETWISNGSTFFNNCCEIKTKLISMITPRSRNYK
jgi:S-methylmethionine-dependent homocysteine/selenocysteine methylase